MRVLICNEYNGYSTPAIGGRNMENNNGAVSSDSKYNIFRPCDRV